MRDVLWRELSRPNKHHRQPIGMNGLDKECNRMRMEDAKHNITHEILDINSKLYHKLLRKVREKNNWKLILWPIELEYIYDMQREYFINYNKLPRDIKNMHDIKMRETVVYFNNQYKSITWDDFDIEYNWFHEWHEKQIEIHKSTAQELIDTLKKQYNIK